MAFIKVGTTAEIIEGKVTTVHVKQGRLGLTRVGDDILAFEDVCTHDDGPLANGEIKGEEITCARHGAAFNMRTGRVLKMPATEDIEVYPVRVNGSDVEVDLA